METPEKIYVNFPFGERHPWRGPMVTKQGLNAEDIEYVHKDVFIEKAISWIDYNNRNGGCNFDGWEKDFKKYMEDKL